MRTLLLAATAAVFFTGSHAQAAIDRCSLPPKSIAAICNKEAGGGCRQGIWYVWKHQIAAKNECVFRRIGGYGSPLSRERR
jgi:hypothetical protein